MRPVIAAGIVLALAGAYVLFHGITYTKEKNVIRLGDLQATVEEKHTVPEWLGVVALAAGVLLVVGGLRRRRLTP